ncbi:arsenate reductase family protein [Oceanobacillus sp. HCA-5259]|uniref:arsenate reductase family protein n=1 Tax=Oceanobacillus sp. HCA-5259 TaxID=3134661 RepID=UPI0030BC944B
MSMTFYWYPKCGTCRNAKKWLEANDIDFEAVHIVEDTPSKDKILQLIEKSGLEPKKFFNMSGKKYRELNMKEKIKDASVEEMAEYLASDGMLIKRPIAAMGDKITVGFKEDEYESTWN